jgi:hypothetical protein
MSAPLPPISICATDLERSQGVWRLGLWVAVDGVHVGGVTVTLADDGSCSPLAEVTPDEDYARVLRRSPTVLLAVPRAVQVQADAVGRQIVALVEDALYQDGHRIWLECTSRDYWRTLATVRERLYLGRNGAYHHLVTCWLTEVLHAEHCAADARALTAAGV